MNVPQERIKISDEKMKFYEDLAEMYVGDDVSPDFYGWVFPKYDHVGVGTGTVINRPAIKEYQKAMRDRAGDKISGGKIIKVWGPCSSHGPCFRCDLESMGVLPSKTRLSERYYDSTYRSLKWPHQGGGPPDP
jgi:flavin-dependent dehydrogenase